MKVLVVSHLYPAPGHERHLFVHQQVVALRDAGVQAHVVSPTGYAPRALWGLHPRLRRRGRTPARDVRDGIAIEYPRVPVLPRLALFQHAGDLFYAAMRRRLTAWRDEGFDLLHAHQAMPDGAAAQRLAAALNVPYMVTVHGRDVNFHLRQDGPIAERTASVLGEAAAVVAVSGAVARRLAPYVAAQRLHVINNGIVGLGVQASPAEFAPGQRLLLSVGYLYEGKGQAIVIDALARLVAGGRDDLLYAVVGEGPLRPALAAQARELAVDNRVRFLGRLPHDELLGLMARADVFVLPSAPEGFGLVYAEALSQGTPVIACRGEGPEDFVTDDTGGLLVPPRDTDAVVAALERLLADPAAARAMGEAGRRCVGELTWERNAERQIAVYEQVLARTPARSRT